ncbi:hypothetical protein DQ04_01191030 [Trypanosoma grayi]|uniref:hypothetical protein n=1 Tax=Trypanosoma grayi TaxID=71804 RepID=UPI0004F43EA5|nr:hypothetical protein DQ04_01191030 [Trypanosoma grayi]KEG13135.1 hypothetical protein DQ04_01191030 [Trypanosoma grayi]
MIPLNGVVACYESSHVPLALVCASPRVRWALEEGAEGPVAVGAWSLRLARDGTRRVTWRPPVALRHLNMAGAMRSVAWWCNRPAANSSEYLPTELGIVAAGEHIGKCLHGVFAFRSLVALSLRRADIEDVNVLGKLPMLKKLDLVQARVVDCGIVGLGESMSLVDVDLWGCSALTDVNTLGSIPTLERLVLAETRASDSGIAGLSNSSSLREVNLEVCNVVKSVGIFGRLPTLQTLLLVTTLVDSSGISELRQSRSLVEIDLWGCDAVDDVGPLGSIPTLRRLDLFGTSVTNEGIIGLGASRSLEEIDLTRCEAVSDVNVLANIPTLRHLVLLHTSVHDVAALFMMLQVTVVM